jgi:dTDP-4-amino-4,6-dideoxygalactose transaminase
MAIGVSLGDEVITTPYTFFATAGAISRLGAKPVFVDINPLTYNINPYLIEEKITSNTKAIIPVHLFGQCAQMEPILEIAKKYNLIVIEDAAQSIGARYKDRMVGSMGDLGCLSFFPSKNLGCMGDGGMVVTNNKELAEKIRILRIHGSKPKYYHPLIGLNSRLDTIQAAILLVKFKYLDEWNKKRRECAEFYNRMFTDNGIVKPYILEDNFSVYNQYVIRTRYRDELRKYLKSKDIECAVYYPLPLHLQECFRDLGYKRSDMPEAELAAQETLALPIYPEISEDIQRFVAEQILGFSKNEVIFKQ